MLHRYTLHVMYLYSSTSGKCLLFMCLLLDFKCKMANYIMMDIIKNFCFDCSSGL